MAEPIFVPVAVLDRRTGSRKFFDVKVDNDEKISQVKEKLVVMTDIPLLEMNIIFCGHKIGDDTILKDLFLGPTTQLTVLRLPPTSVPQTPSTSIQKITAMENPQIGSFYVYCKDCSQIARGKLRVYCEKCESSSVVVKSEPSCWNDVLKSKRIMVSCENCNSESSFAVFKFKCIKCNEICAPLAHIRTNWNILDCCICGENSHFVFDLGCSHPTCPDCFKEYVVSCLSENRFELRPPLGFTIQCPFTACNRYVKDVHHFYVAGKEVYQKYQQKATERLVTIDDEGVCCPSAKCGAYFFWEPENEDNLTQCPECHLSFCMRCKSKDCTCQEMDDETKETIETTTKKCPKCAAPTERNGGCAHIHCPSCSLDWCFLCRLPWTEDCQWNHWFG
ncbi:unnamed protein product [Caenorhabditis auriculariae]|uniref:E3 ubiquitin-protein ligase parkin n=1 Tax=Caenorhabditis auriculariae TaxID=2777116 RepID=A0A8S1GXG8_9PELO|nr:unnamed protein product [Caenorhabditis auriculariae]